MSPARAKRRALTLGEHFFWTMVTGVTVCLTVAILLFIAA